MHESFLHMLSRLLLRSSSVRSAIAGALLVAAAASCGTGRSDPQLQSQTEVPELAASPFDGRWLAVRYETRGPFLKEGALMAAALMAIELHFRGGAVRLKAVHGSEHIAVGRLIESGAEHRLQTDTQDYLHDTRVRLISNGQLRVVGQLGTMYLQPLGSVDLATTRVCSRLIAPEGARDSDLALLFAPAILERRQGPQCPPGESPVCLGLPQVDAVLGCREAATE